MMNNDINLNRFDVGHENQSSDSTSNYKRDLELDTNQFMNPGSEIDLTETLLFTHFG